MARHVVRTRQRRASSAPRLLAPVVLFLVLLTAVLGFRTHLVQTQASGRPVVAAAASVSFPTNPVIEASWGIRFTAVNVLADGGMLEVRYIVLDPAKGARIHSGNLKDLPYLRADDTGKEVHSSSLMFHLHANHVPSEVDGRTYSIVFGNSDGAARRGGTVSLILADGLRLERIPVT